ncbi:hypothetical protein AGRA3207_001497 [Actinomadura graeca]|uniref:Uncharacterized protein n=1 Tax=Actinomadura graeca TaxID=2750812 RepID=A0ABX8QPR2_9ACTN|nr:hypothetical protein [Actinomadura graeca]QXJ20732.1 hypothetical protein AGRA3207_001497 [Actinomadura graeca]
MNPAAETAGPYAPRPIRGYFVAPPEERDLSIGLTLAIIGSVMLLGAFVLPFIFFGAGAASSEEDPSTAAIAILFALITFFGGNLVGWPLLIFGSIRLFRYQRQKSARTGAPSDEQMDQWFFDDMRRIEHQATQEMNIPAETITRRPLLVVGPALPTDYAIGLDGKPRYASYEVAVVVLTRHQVCAYTCVLNFATGVRDLETTHEFMISDVTTIGTINDRLADHGGGASSGRVIRMAGPIAMSFLTPADVSVRQEFRITLTSGDALAVNVGCHVNGTTLSDEGYRGYVRDTVRALRATLRAIKSPDPTDEP